jgi:CDP-diacylglycerol pyrophosphatase
MGIQEDLLLDQPSPIMNANASNDFMGDRFGYGVPTEDTNNMINSGPGRTPEQAMLNQIR